MQQQEKEQSSCSTRISLLRTNFKNFSSAHPTLFTHSTRPSPPVGFEWLSGVFNLLQFRQRDIIIPHIQLAATYGLRFTLKLKSKLLVVLFAFEMRLAGSHLI